MKIIASVSRPDKQELGLWKPLAKHQILVSDEAQEF
jgi:hypothetical protein